MVLNCVWNIHPHSNMAADTKKKWKKINISSETTKKILTKLAWSVLGWSSLQIMSDKSAHLQIWQPWLKIEIFIFNISSETKLAWKDLGWSYLKNCVRNVHPPSNMTAIAKNRNIKIYIWWKIVYCMGLRVHKHSDVFHSYCLRFLGLFTGRLGLYSTAVYCVITSSIAFLVRNETICHISICQEVLSFGFPEKIQGEQKGKFFLALSPI